MEPYKIPIDIKHASSSMMRINEHLHRHQLCDVTIIAGSKRLPAHRLVLSSVSDYFQAMFNNDVQEAVASEVTIHNIEPFILEMLIQYMYTGKLEITEENVEKVLSAANMLQLHVIVKASCEFLQKQLHPSNCLGIRLFADQQSCENLCRTANQYIIDHFMDVIRNQEFLSLPLDQVCELLSNDCVNVPCEKVIFEAMLLWVRYSEDNRKQHLPKLLTQIRLAHLPKEYIADVVQSNPLIRENLICEHQIIDAMIHHMLPARCSCLSSPRSSTIGHLYAIGGMDNSKGATSIECFDKRLNVWSPVAHMTGRRLQFGVAVLEDKLYVVGGRDGLKTLNSVECFNPTTKTWCAMPPVATHRHGLGVAVLCGPMYAVGGHDGWSYLNTVERWDPQARAWNYVAPMSVARSTAGVAVLFDKLYAVGGRDGSSCLRSVECFDPHTNKWSNCASMSKRRGGVGVGVCGAHLYAIGGHDAPASNQLSQLSESVERYDTKTDQWTIVASMSVPRDAVGICPLGGRLYACGGYDGQSYLSTCESYDPESNEWRDVAPLITGRAGAVLVHIKSRF